MSISMYQASAPVLDRNLGNLASILTKAAAWAEARKIDQAVLLSSRLAPDMFALSRQMQIACDFAKGTCARLAGVEVPKYDDNETGFADFQARIAKTRQYISTFKAAHCLLSGFVWCWRVGKPDSGNLVERHQANLKSECEQNGPLNRVPFPHLHVTPQFLRLLNCRE